MNYAGHETLRAEVALLASSMCDLRITLKVRKTVITGSVTGSLNDWPGRVCGASTPCWMKRSTKA